eukprot:TRINITY_DN1849_c0_g1_i3.p1 TRINITY_DN1849_c0_g1~~TRINITY_DN1849_c0_g1_i3.p1  ORF type:complete len:305 (-),score=46.70 TRINITY_DN1849_c0_g1_i3:260-1174(-)
MCFSVISQVRFFVREFLNRRFVMFSNGLLKRITEDEALLKQFEDHLAKTYTLENWQFVSEVNLFKQIPDLDTRIKRAKEISDLYVTETSSRQINVDMVKRESVIESIGSGDVAVFDELVSDICHMLEFDIGRKFMSSMPQGQDSDKEEKTNSGESKLKSSKPKKSLNFKKLTKPRKRAVSDTGDGKTSKFKKVKKHKVVSADHNNDNTNSNSSSSDTKGKKPKALKALLKSMKKSHHGGNKDIAPLTSRETYDHQDFHDNSDGSCHESPRAHSASLEYKHRRSSSGSEDAKCAESQGNYDCFSC